MDETALTVVQTDIAMPAMSIEQALTRRNRFVEFVRDILTEGIDFGKVPGTEKPTLLKPGAEKLTTFFGLRPKFSIVKETEQWGDNGQEPFFYYWYRCHLYRNDMLIAEGDGSCNSRESKYRWRWVQPDDLPVGVDTALLKKRGGTVSEFDFAVDKAETTGKYGKPLEYWQAFKDAITNSTARKIQKQTRSGKFYDAWEIDSLVYRVPNEDVFSQVNTLQKMAQKRALVGATLLAVNASEFFTQDMEDLDIIDVDITSTPASVDIKRQPKHQATRQQQTNGGPKANGSKRPLEPAVVKAFLHQKARSGGNGPATEKQIPFLARKFAECFSGAEDAELKYHSCLVWLWGTDSAKTLTLGQAKATLDWLLANTGPDDSGDIPLHEHAPEEAHRVLRLAMKDAGQSDMFNTDEENEVPWDEEQTEYDEIEL